MTRSWARSCQVTLSSHDFLKFRPLGLTSLFSKVPTRYSVNLTILWRHKLQKYVKLGWFRVTKAINIERCMYFPNLLTRSKDKYEKVQHAKSELAWPPCDFTIHSGISTEGVLRLPRWGLSDTVWMAWIWPLHTDLKRPKMWPIFEFRHVQNWIFYSLSAFQRTKASQDIHPFVLRLLIFCVHDSKVRCFSVLCRAGYAHSN